MYPPPTGDKRHLCSHWANACLLTKKCAIKELCMVFATRNLRKSTIRKTTTAILNLKQNLKAGVVQHLIPTVIQLLVCTWIHRGFPTFFSLSRGPTTRKNGETSGFRGDFHCQGTKVIKIHQLTTWLPRRIPLTPTADIPCHHEVLTDRRDPVLMAK